MYGMSQSKRDFALQARYGKAGDWLRVEVGRLLRHKVTSVRYICYLMYGRMAHKEGDVHFAGRDRSIDLLNRARVHQPTGFGKCGGTFAINTVDGERVQGRQIEAS